jgi:anti-sigma B factor antagonist
MANLVFHTMRGNPALAVVAPRGELDLSGATVLEAELERLEQDSGLRTVVLDLRGLQFIDSSGLRLVILTDRRWREAGRRVALVRGPDTVHRVFEITQMNERLDFVTDPEDAAGER